MSVTPVYPLFSAVETAMETAIGTSRIVDAAKWTVKHAPPGETVGSTGAGGFSYPSLNERLSLLIG